MDETSVYSVVMTSTCFQSSRTVSALPASEILVLIKDLVSGLLCEINFKPSDVRRRPSILLLNFFLCHPDFNHPDDREVCQWLGTISNDKLIWIIRIPSNESRCSISVISTVTLCCCTTICQKIFNFSKKSFSFFIFHSKCFFNFFFYLILVLEIVLVPV